MCLFLAEVAHHPSLQPTAKEGTNGLTKSSAIRASIVPHPALIRRNSLQKKSVRAFRQRARERESTLTYEELIVAIDDAAPRLSEASLRLLLRLVSLAIQTGSSEVRASHEWLAGQLGMSEEGIARGKRGLAGIIKAEGGNRVTTTYVMPADWFTPQRSLFAVPSGQIPRPDWPTNQARSGLPTRPALANEPGQSGQPTRPVWPTNQASWPTNQASLANEPGQSGLPTRPALTQNQPLSGSPPDQIRSDQIGSLEPSVVLINQIAQIDNLKEEQVEDARTLASRLVGYAAAYGHGRIREQKPSERILARCLAIAPVDTLIKTLSLMAGKSVSCGEKYAWFVTVFLNRIHGIESKLVVQVFENVLQKKKAGRHTDPLYTEQLLQQTAAGVRTMQ